MQATSLVTFPVACAFRQMRIAIMLAGLDRESRAVADALAARFRTRRLVVDVIDHLDVRALRCDAVVLGCRTGVDTHVHTIARFVEETRPSLDRVATAVFLVCPETASDSDGPLSGIDAFVSAARWRPDLVAAFEYYPDVGHHGAMVRWILKHMTRHADPAVAATDVTRFADAVASGLAQAPEPGHVSASGAR